MTPEDGMTARAPAGRGNHPDMAFGAALVAIAAVALIEIRGLGSGSASSMGGGYVPRALSGFLLLMGVFYCVRGVLSRPRVPLPRVAWKSLSLVTASIAAFALSLESLGLFTATLLMTVLASLANREQRWGETIVFAIGMAVFTVAVFVWGLNIVLPVWPVFR